MKTKAIALVQLPFPSQLDPLPELQAYYDNYFERYVALFPSYSITTGDLWEAPLWVAHLDGAIGRDDTCFVDLSMTPSCVSDCVNSISRQVSVDHVLLFSPLAQNFQLAADVSSALRKLGYKTVVGGNMAALASSAQFDVVVDGIVNSDIYQVIHRALNNDEFTPIQFIPKLGRSAAPIRYRPRYRLLSAFGKRAPMLRVNASHGCLYGCTFCGDAWSKQLHLVERELLKREVLELRELFPHTDTIYIGDKTFGQSPESVENLKHCIDPQWKWRLVVQTHASVVSETLVQSMVDLGVVACEIGFETADSLLLRDMKKGTDVVRVNEAVALLNAAGIRVILNVLGGLPHATKQSAQRTMEFMTELADMTYLYNLYNFVPYPKTPLFATIKDRIVDWDFANWREDKPVVFTPYEQSANELWDDFLSIVGHAHSLIGRPT
jgi:radical SAM superfamily enzyme YgiQ (UPF0313 family)